MDIKAKAIGLIRAHKRLTVIIFLWVVFCGFFIIPNWHEGPEPLYFLVFSIGFVTLISAQLFWIGAILAFGKRFISGKPQRVWLAIILIVVYALFLAHNFGIGDRLLGGDSTHLTMRRLAVDGVWSVWLVGSWVGFGLVMVFWTVDRMTRTATWVYHKARNAASSHADVPIPGTTASDPPSPDRRRLLGVSTMSLSPAELRPLAGIYRDPKTGNVWRVSLAAGKLWVEFEESLLELRPLSPTEFQTVDYPMDVHLKFEAARGDAQRRLIVDTWSQLPAPAEKIAETKPGSGELVTYAGDYWSDELRATYRFTIKDDKLWMKELIGADGVVHEGTVPFDELRPVVADEFDLKAPMVIHFMRNTTNSVIGFTLNGFHERGILFSRSGELHSKLEPDAVRTSE